MKVAVVGATGLVGQTLLPFLEKEPIEEITLISSTAGQSIFFGDKTCKTVELSKGVFVDTQVAFFCVNDSIAKTWKDEAVASGCLVIDNSSAFRMTTGVPLVVPEINANLIPKTGIVANPNCSTIILCMLLNSLTRKDTLHIQRVDVSTYQAVSGAGKAGLEQLKEETSKYPLKADKHLFGAPILNNCISHNSAVDSDTGYNKEELKMIQETDKIMGYSVSATCVRVPVQTCHTESVTVEFEEKTNYEDVKALLETDENIVVQDDREGNKFPTPLATSGTLKVAVGHIRKDYYDSTKFHFLICGDQLLKGAAYNAFQIYQHWKTM